MQHERDRTTLGIALLVAGAAVIGNAYPWISAPLIMLAVFFIAWGRDQRRIEALVGRLPAGPRLLKCLNQLDLIISPRTDPKNRLQYCLFVTAAVVDQFISGGKKLEGRIQLENTSNEPLEIGPAVFRGLFQSDEPKIINGLGSVLQPHKGLYFPFEFDERAMAQGSSSVNFMADIDYGPPGIRTGRLHKKIEVEYTVSDQGFITQQTAKDREYQDIAI
jgi:hypothetical protein